MADLTPIIEQAFTQYAGAVLQSRALVDVRDGLKPSARQILYCLYTDKFTQNHPFKKTLKAIGSASRMYLHGDSSAEGIIMRSGQPFAMRYPLIEVEGSFGNLMESGNWAAPRYTSSRLTNLTELMFQSINKNTINVWYDNYDDTEKYPSVLPSIGFYGLVEGTMGIGIGASSSIAPTNLKEVNEAIIKLIQNPNTSFEEIVCYPDFPTGATILNKSEVKESLRTGQGNSCKIQSTISYEQKDNCLIVTEIPYMVYTNTICKELEAIIESEDNHYIESFNDLTGSNPLIKIYLKSNVNPQKVIKFLYKNTSLESYYAINMTMLKDGKYPQVFGWKECLQEYITHIRTCKHNEIQFDLDKALARENVVNGLLIAAASIDEVVALIRASHDPSEATNKLIARFGFNEEQVKAILAMKLSSLTKIDAIKLDNELADLKQKISNYRYLLSDSVALDNELIKILREVANKFGDARKTRLLDVKEENEEEPIKETNVRVLIFDNDSIRMVEAASPNGKIARGVHIKEEFTATNLDSIKIVTNFGRIYQTSLSSLELGQDYPVHTLVSLQTNEKPLLIISSFLFSSYRYLVTVTSNNLIKKTKTEEFSEQNSKRGGITIKLEENASVICSFLCQEEGTDILTFGSNSYYARFPINSFSDTGKSAKGVRIMKLEENDTILSAYPIIVGLTEKIKLGNRSYAASSFAVTGRAVKGRKNNRGQNE